MPKAGAGMLKYTYISSSILACSCGGQLVQLPGSETVNPATSLPASMFLASSMWSCREDPDPPVVNFRPGSVETFEKCTTCKGYRVATSAENSAISAVELLTIFTEE